MLVAIAPTLFPVYCAIQRGTCPWHRAHLGSRRRSHSLRAFFFSHGPSVHDVGLFSLHVVCRSRVVSWGLQAVRFPVAVQKPLGQHGQRHPTTYVAGLCCGYGGPDRFASRQVLRCKPVPRRCQRCRYCSRHSRLDCSIGALAYSTCAGFPAM